MSWPGLSLNLTPHLSANCSDPGLLNQQLQAAHVAKRQAGVFFFGTIILFFEKESHWAACIVASQSYPLSFPNADIQSPAPHKNSL